MVKTSRPRAEGASTHIEEQRRAPDGAASLQLAHADLSTRMLIGSHILATILCASHCPTAHGEGEDGRILISFELANIDILVRVLAIILAYVMEAIGTR